MTILWRRVNIPISSSFAPKIYELFNQMVGYLRRRCRLSPLPPARGKPSLQISVVGRVDTSSAQITRAASQWNSYASMAFSMALS